LFGELWPDDAAIEYEAETDEFILASAREDLLSARLWLALAEHREFIEEEARRMSTLAARNLARLGVRASREAPAGGTEPTT
jgi:hypothetical protein